MDKIGSEIFDGAKGVISWHGLGAALGLMVMLAILGYWGLSPARIEGKMRSTVEPPFQIPGF